MTSRKSSSERRISLLERLAKLGLRLAKIGGGLVSAPSATAALYSFYGKHSFLATITNPIFLIPILTGMGLIIFGCICIWPFFRAGSKLRPFKEAKTKVAARPKQRSSLEICIKGMEELVKGETSGIMNAISFFDRAIGGDPKSKYAYYCKAIAIMKLAQKTGETQNLKQAEICIKKALKIDRKFGDAKRLLAELRRLRRRR